MNNIKIIETKRRFAVRVEYQSESGATATVDIPANTYRGAMALKRSLDSAAKEHGVGKSF